MHLSDLLLLRHVGNIGMQNVNAGYSSDCSDRD